MNQDLLKTEFVPKYREAGEPRFYRFVLVYALNKLVLIEQKVYKGMPPHLEFLEYYDRFLIMYRREGEEIYLQIAKVFRKVAHKIYRIMLKKKMIEFDNKFLNSV